MNLAKLRAGFDVLRAGAQVANALKLRQKQVLANGIATLLVALAVAARAWGYPIPLTDSDFTMLGLGLATLVNWVCTVATDARLGLSGRTDVSAVAPGSARVEPTDAVPPVVQPTMPASPGPEHNPAFRDDTGG